jgi:hemerythrin-like domain-containing protein
MPRAGVLLSLSREHHSALVLARTAQRAAEAAEAGETGAVRSAISEIEAHWQAVMASHFRREERLIQRAKDALDARSAQQIMAEHAELRMLATGPCDLEPAVRLRRFADLLRAHVRYEERVLFPQLQTHDSVRHPGEEG